MEVGQLDLWQLILSAGIVVKSVLIGLIGFSIYGWTVILYKYKQFKKLNIANANFYKLFHESKDLNHIIEQIEHHKDSSLMIMFQKGYLELLRIKESLLQISSGDQTSDKALISQFHAHFLDNIRFHLESVQRTLDSIMIKLGQILEDRLSVLATIGSIAPFVGLFGTVWGIIDAFAGLATGQGSIEAVAPGIAEALIATAIGLAAAIPAVWFFNIFSHKVSLLREEMERFEKDFVNISQRYLLDSKKS